MALVRKALGSLRALGQCEAAFADFLANEKMVSNDVKSRR